MTSFSPTARASEVQAAPGHFGPYGGQYVPETLMPALGELIAAYEHSKTDRAFQATLAELRALR